MGKMQKENKLQSFPPATGGEGALRVLSTCACCESEAARMNDRARRGKRGRVRVCVRERVGAGVHGCERAVTAAMR